MKDVKISLKNMAIILLIGVTTVFATTAIGGNLVGTITGTVNGVSTATTPVLFKDMDNAARNPFTFTETKNFQDVFEVNFVTEAVPEGKRLVIEQVSVNMKIPSITSTGLPIYVIVTTQVGGRDSKYDITLTDLGRYSEPDIRLYVAGSQMRSYADPGTIVTTALHSPGCCYFSGNATVSLSGYFVDLT